MVPEKPIKLGIKDSKFMMRDQILPDFLIALVSLISLIGFKFHIKVYLICLYLVSMFIIRVISVSILDLG